MNFPNPLAPCPWNQDIDDPEPPAEVAFEPIPDPWFWRWMLWLALLLIPISIVAGSALIAEAIAPESVARTLGIDGR